MNRRQAIKAGIYLKSHNNSRYLEGEREQVARDARLYKRMGEAITEVVKCQT
jgi:hypothetical protein